MGFRLRFISAFTSEIAFLATRECFQRTIRRGLVCSARRPRYRAPYREVSTYLEAVARESRAPPNRIFRRNEVHETRRNCGRKYARINRVNRDRGLRFQGNALLEKKNPESSDLIEDRTRVSAGEEKRKGNFRRRRI